MGPLDQVDLVAGAALEGLVFQHLIAWNAYGGNKNTLSYWHTRAGNEVDFIVYGPNGIFAIEVKNSKRIRSDEFSGLLAFKEDYPQAQCILVYRGLERLKIKGVLCIPCKEFLLGLVPGERILK